MVQISLEQADNGIIKTVQDDNSNGAGESFESKTVYDLKKENDFVCVKRFLFDITTDLGIETGNTYSKNNLVMRVDWGGSYEPTKQEIENKIKDLEIEIAYLEQISKKDD